MNAYRSWPEGPDAGTLSAPPRAPAGPDDCVRPAAGTAVHAHAPATPHAPTHAPASVAAANACDPAAAALADRARRELLAGLSHALRTPLHQATGLVHLLERAQAEADGPRFTTFLGYLDTSCRELRRRIEALLAHAHRCSLVPAPQAVDLSACLSALLDPLQPVALRRQVGLDWSCPPDLVALADPAALRDALAALVDNAIAYTREPGHVRVIARAVAPAEVRIDVVDDGIGIAAADLSRLFVEFVRLPAGEARRPDGLGLGLAACRRLVTAMGGRVDAFSRVDRGSRFTITLPRRRP